jgi:hypothetical protein
VFNSTCDYFRIKSAYLNVIRKFLKSEINPKQFDLEFGKIYATYIRYLEEKESQDLTKILETKILEEFEKMVDYIFPLVMVDFSAPQLKEEINKIIMSLKFNFRRTIGIFLVIVLNTFSPKIASAAKYFEFDGKQVEVKMIPKFNRSGLGVSSGPKLLVISTSSPNGTCT